MDKDSHYFIKLEITQHPNETKAVDRKRRKGNYCQITNTKL